MTETAQYLAELPIQVQAGQTLILEIRAKPQAPQGQTGSFDVQLQLGDTPPGALTAVYLVGAQNYTVPVDAQGHGRLDGIAPGTYTLQLEPGASAGTGSFDLRLLDADGNPVAGGGQVYLVGGQTHTVTLDDQGHGRVDGVAAGTYELRTENPQTTGGDSPLLGGGTPTVASRGSGGAIDKPPAGCASLKQFPDVLIRIGGTLIESTSSFTDAGVSRAASAGGIRLEQDLLEIGNECKELIVDARGDPAKWVSLGRKGRLLVHFTPGILVSDATPRIGTLKYKETDTKEKNPTVLFGHRLIDSATKSVVDLHAESAKYSAILLPLGTSLSRLTLENPTATPDLTDRYEWIQLTDTGPHVQDDVRYPGVDISDIWAEQNQRSVLIILDISGSMSDDLPRNFYGLKKAIPAPDSGKRIYSSALAAIREFANSSANTGVSFALQEFHSQFITEPASLAGMECKMEPPATTLVWRPKSSFSTYVSEHASAAHASHPFYHGTPLKFAIHSAATTLTTRPERCRLLIVITDGDGSGSESIAELKTASIAVTDPCAIEFVSYGTFSEQDIGDRGTTPLAQLPNTAKLRKQISEFSLDWSGWQLNTHLVDDSAALLSLLKSIASTYGL